MAGLKIDDAELDTQLTGLEKLPCSDNATPKAILLSDLARYAARNAPSASRYLVQRLRYDPFERGWKDVRLWLDGNDFLGKKLELERWSDQSGYGFDATEFRTLPDYRVIAEEDGVHFLTNHLALFSAAPLTTYEEEDAPEFVSLLLLFTTGTASDIRFIYNEGQRFAAGLNVFTHDGRLYVAIWNTQQEEWRTHYDLGKVAPLSPVSLVIIYERVDARLSFYRDGVGVLSAALPSKLWGTHGSLAGEPVISLGSGNSLTFLPEEIGTLDKETLFDGRFHQLIRLQGADAFLGPEDLRLPCARYCPSLHTTHNRSEKSVFPASGATTLFHYHIATGAPATLQIASMVNANAIALFADARHLHIEKAQTRFELDQGEVTILENVPPRAILRSSQPLFGASALAQDPENWLFLLPFAEAVQHSFAYLDNASDNNRLLFFGGTNPAHVRMRAADTGRLLASTALDAFGHSSLPLEKAGLIRIESTMPVMILLASETQDGTIFLQDGLFRTMRKRFLLHHADQDVRLLASVPTAQITWKDNLGNSGDFTLNTEQTALIEASSFTQGDSSGDPRAILLESDNAVAISTPPGAFFSPLDKLAQNFPLPFAYKQPAPTGAVFTVLSPYQGEITIRSYGGSYSKKLVLERMDGVDSSFPCLKQVSLESDFHGGWAEGTIPFRIIARSAQNQNLIEKGLVSTDTPYMPVGTTSETQKTRFRSDGLERLRYSLLDENGIENWVLA